MFVILCPAPLGVGPIEWNYRCTGRRDKLNQLQRVSGTACCASIHHVKNMTVFDKRIPSWFKIVEKEH